jgi:predicted ATPase
VSAGLGEGRADVETQLGELARRRQFIQDCGVQELPNGESVAWYGFIHALYQNVLYDRMPASRRVQLHRRIGEQEEEIHGERAGEIAAELAMHFERGSSYKQSVRYLQRAAENAMRRFAYKEAIGLSRRGLELVERLPEGRERVRQELSLHLTLGVPLTATEGYAAPDVCSAYTRARELCQQLGETPETLQVLWGLWSFLLVKAELGRARKIAEEFLCLAETRYSGHVMRGHGMIEITLTHLGEFAVARDYLENALLLHDPQRHRDESFRYTQTPEVATRGHGAWALWFLGQPDQALHRIQEALALTRELSEPHGLAHAFFFAATLHQFRREERMAFKYAEAALTVSSEHGLALYQAVAMIVRGWALNQQGQKEAIEQMRSGLDALKATGSELLRPHFLALLVEALSTSQQAEEGLRIADEALEMANRNGEGYYLAELYRLKGELLLLRAKDRGASRATRHGKASVKMEAGAAAQVEDCFNQSIRIAQQQHAKAWELRAVMSLIRLYRNQTKQKEALCHLKRVYGSFTEGLDTKDLSEAKALLTAPADQESK